jgi:hypothetical protein
MKEKINKREYNLYISKFIKFAIIPLFLLLLWFGLTFLYIIHLDTAFSLLSYNLPKTVFTHLPQDKLEKGNFVSGEFVAQDNNLGILSLRFETFFRPAYQNEDLLLFQLREKGSGNWYYENIYRDGTIYDVPFFPFGFPIINDSRGKIYEFRITSLKGDNSNSVAISQRWQNIAAKYKFTGHELLQNKAEFLQFSVKKFFSSLQTIDVLFSSLVYLLPLFFYLILLSPFGKYLEKSLMLIDRKFSLTFFKFSQSFSLTFFDAILLGAVLLDGFYLRLGNDFIYLLIPILWIVVQRHLRFTSKKTFIVAIALLLFPPVLLQFNLGQIAENVAVWSYLFLVAGTIQALTELRSLKVK